MEELEKRIAKVEKKINTSHAIDAEKVREFMQSGLFGLACFVERETLKRELTDKEKLELGIRLYQSGTWTVNNLVRILIEMDAEAREEEKRISSNL